MTHSQSVTARSVAHPFEQDTPQPLEQLPEAPLSQEASDKPPSPTTPRTTVPSPPLPAQAISSPPATFSRSPETGFSSVETRSFTSSTSPSFVAAPTSDKSFSSPGSPLNISIIPKSLQRTQSPVASSAVSMSPTTAVEPGNGHAFSLPKPPSTLEGTSPPSSYPPSRALTASASGAVSAVPSTDTGDLMHEAGALFFMQQDHEATADPQPLTMAPSIYAKDDVAPLAYADDDATSYSSHYSRAYDGASPASYQGHEHRRQESFTPIAVHRAQETAPAPLQNGSLASAPTRSGLGRKPSGARAPAPSSRGYASSGGGPASIASQRVTEETQGPVTSSPPPPLPPAASEMQHTREPSGSSSGDAPVDALMALRYLNMADDGGAESQSVSESASSPQFDSVSPASVQMDGPRLKPIDTRGPGSASSASPQIPSGDLTYKSSFAPSSKAAERKMKAEAQKAAKHRPGRANGKRQSHAAGAWESSEEEDDEEEDDDDDLESDVGRPPASARSQAVSTPGGFNSGRPSPLPLQSPNPFGGPDQLTPTPATAPGRPPRNLPQPPQSMYRNSGGTKFSLD